MSDAERKDADFPISAGILFGLGLGGFFDGIVLHQVLQWHHMLTSAGYPADSVPNLEINTLCRWVPLHGGGLPRGIMSVRAAHAPGAAGLTPFCGIPVLAA
jgi:Predicted membrane protein (DUF2243)